MLVSITESCHMGCTHCMDDAKPCDKHMDEDTFKKVIDFFNLHSGVELIITGGEPTDNPLWMNMFSYALENAEGLLGKAHITLTTNAMNIANDQDVKQWLLYKMDKYPNFHIQVTHVDEYYPIDVDFSSIFFKCDRVIICNEIEHMYPIGRAKENNLPWSSKASKCFNLRSILRSTRNFDNTMLFLSANMKFCTPQIDIYGNIKLGESMLCPVCSNIDKPINEIVDDIYNFKCSGCDIINNKLSDAHLRAIGEK